MCLVSVQEMTDTTCLTGGMETDGYLNCFIFKTRGTGDVLLFSSVFFFLDKKLILKRERDPKSLPFGKSHVAFSKPSTNHLLLWPT